MQVLLAHHDRWTRLVLADVLAHAGYVVAEVSNGIAALRMAAQMRPALVVLSTRLSELSSSDVRAALKADPTTRGIGVFVMRDRAAAQVPSVVATYARGCRHCRSRRARALAPARSAHLTQRRLVRRTALVAQSAG